MNTPKVGILLGEKKEMEKQWDCSKQKLLHNQILLVRLFWGHFFTALWIKFSYKKLPMSIFITLWGFGLFLAALETPFPRCQWGSCSYCSSQRLCDVQSVLLITHRLSRPAGVGIAEKQKTFNKVPGLCQQPKSPAIPTSQQPSTQEHCCSKPGECHSRIT